MQADGIIPLTESYVVIDARGSGAGWSVQASFTSTDATAYPTAGTLDKVNGEADLPQTSPLPAALTSSAAVIAQANRNRGNGQLRRPACAQRRRSELGQLRPAHADARAAGKRVTSRRRLPGVPRSRGHLVVQSRQIVLSFVDRLLRSRASGGSDSRRAGRGGGLAVRPNPDLRSRSADMLAPLRR